MILQYSNNIYPLDLFVGTIDDILYAEKNFLFYYSIQDLQTDEPIDNAKIGDVTNTSSGITYIVKHKKQILKGY